MFLSALVSVLDSQVLALGFLSLPEALERFLETKKQLLGT